MEEITLAYSSPAELWQLIDKDYNHVFVHQYCPVEMMEWWKTDFKAREGMVFNDLVVRSLQMDVKTDLEGLKKIISLRNSYPLRIYQFRKEIPDSLDKDKVPDDFFLPSPGQEGMHYFNIDPQFITLKSADHEFIMNIAKNPDLQNRIRSRK